MVSQVELYNDYSNQFANNKLPLNLQIQNLTIPEPYCLDCKGEVWFDIAAKNTNYSSSKLIIINGPLSSGKTSLAKKIANQHNFLHLDGEAINHMIKTKQWLNNLHDNSIHADLLFMTEACLDLDHNVIISHTISPDFWILYEHFFREKNINFEHIVLLPDQETLTERNRLCKYKTTEDEDLENSFRQFNSSNSLDEFIYDNTGESVNQSMEMLFMALFPYEQKIELIWEKINFASLIPTEISLNLQ